MNIAVDVSRSSALPELNSSSTASQFRDQAARYHALTAQTGCPARQALYRRLKRNYLTLANCEDDRANSTSSVRRDSVDSS
jgi:hypothetical protein